MKKLVLCMLMFLFVLPFSGCSEKAPEKINLHINSSYTAEMGGLNLEGLLIYTEDSEMYIDVSTPDELSGLSFSFDEDFTIGFRGLNAVTERDYLPESSFAQSIKNSLDDALLTKPPLEKTEDKKYTATAKSSSGCYKIQTDEEGNILALEVPGAKLKLKILNNNL